MNIQKITTQNKLNQFIELLDDIYNHKKGLYFFRGLKNSDYQLLPGAFRPGDIRNRELLFDGYKAHILANSDKALDIVLMYFFGNLQLPRRPLPASSFRIRSSKRSARNDGPQGNNTIAIF